MMIQEGRPGCKGTKTQFARGHAIKCKGHVLVTKRALSLPGFGSCRLFGSRGVHSGDVSSQGNKGGKGLRAVRTDMTL